MGARRPAGRVKRHPLDTASALLPPKPRPLRPHASGVPADTRGEVRPPGAFGGHDSASRDRWHRNERNSLDLVTSPHTGALPPCRSEISNAVRPGAARAHATGPAVTSAGVRGVLAGLGLGLGLVLGTAACDTGGSSGASRYCDVVKVVQAGADPLADQSIYGDPARLRRRPWRCG